MRIDVLYQFNEKYAPYAGVSITSLLENNRHFDQIRIFILGEELSRESCNKLTEAVSGYGREIRFLDTKSQIENMKEAKMPAYRGSYAANLRLFLPYLVDETVERILYLDADTAVVGRLDGLLAAAEGERPLYMVLDSLGRKHKEEIGLGAEDCYYNSGVILFDLKEWKRQRLSDKIADHVKHVRSNYPAPDQDLLNVVCRGQIGTLPPQYNFQPIHMAFPIHSYCKIYTNVGYYTEDDLEQAGKNVCIYHFFRFLGEFPWDKGNTHPDNGIFDEYLQKSLWKDYQKKEVKLGMVFAIEKRLYMILPRALFLRIFKLAHRLFIIKSNKMSLEDKVNPDM